MLQDPPLRSEDTVGGGGPSDVRAAARNRGIPPWDALPQDLQREILDMLPSRHACVVRAVRKDWCEMVDELWADRDDDDDDDWPEERIDQQQMGMQTACGCCCRVVPV